MGMAFLKRILEPPRYGFDDPIGQLVKPTSGQILQEFFYRINFIRDRRNWLSFWAWFAAACLIAPLVVFLTQYFSWKLFILGFVYSMVVLGTHGTIYLHRFSTHRAYRFRNLFWTFVCRNLVIKIIPEETYVVSHHVHHRFVEQPGDPYNVHGGFLYCFLADVNHQPISRTLSEPDYKRVVGLVAHTGLKPNSYAQYQRWGSIAQPHRMIFHFVANWIFWYRVLFLVGGHALATAIFGMSAIWAFGVRTFNFDGHGKGKDRRRVGIDFHWEDLSVNQVWPGYVAGEWHNNHHLFPSSARCGFLPYQVDLAWYFIKTWHSLGLISEYRDDKPQFMEKHFLAQNLEGSERPKATIVHSAT